MNQRHGCRRAFSSREGQQELPIHFVRVDKMRRPTRARGSTERKLSMRGHRRYAIAGFAALFACALIATGCGDGGSDSTATTTTPGANAQQKVDSAVKSCNQEAQQLGGTAGNKLETGCGLIGAAAKQALSRGGEAAAQALSQAVSGCRNAIGNLPKGQAQDALSKFCDSIASAQ
jgi:hypothetical protein